MSSSTQVPRALMLAGLLAAAGLAQAQSYDAPQQAGEASTMTNGVPNAATTNSPYPDGTVVLTAPATTIDRYVEVPATTVVVTPVAPDTTAMGAAAATSNVPDRAGEASTMTHGVPNASTNNDAPVLTLRQVGPDTYYVY